MSGITFTISEEMFHNLVEDSVSLGIIEAALGGARFDDVGYREFLRAKVNLEHLDTP